MKIDRAAHEAAIKQIEEVMTLGEGWHMLQPGQELWVKDNDLVIAFDWLEWLNIHVDRFIRPSRECMFDVVVKANPEFWQDVAHYRAYLPEWVVCWVMRFKYGKDSLL